MKSPDLDEGIIRIIYSIPFKITMDTRLAILQFNIIHHILPTIATPYTEIRLSQLNNTICALKYNNNF